MPLKIVRNDITKMEVDAVVNTASSSVNVGPGCDYAIYNAAGFDELFECRKKVGDVPEGDAFITEGFALPARFIIHAVSPLYIDGESGEEEKLRSCYRNSLKLAVYNGLKSVAFPLISTGAFGYPREEGMRIAIDEINAFLIHNPILVYIVVYDSHSAEIGKRISGSLESYIDDCYVDTRVMLLSAPVENKPAPQGRLRNVFSRKKATCQSDNQDETCEAMMDMAPMCARPMMAMEYKSEDSLDRRLSHMTDSFSQYLLYLIERKGMSNADVYKRAVVDKKVFSKIKNNSDYHPNKMTAMCLCVGACLSLDDTKDLLSRAGYALSPCDKTDVIFSYFIEHEIFDIIEIDIALEEHDLPCLIA